jgi:EAL domain-containing protein (putative c-di-GMP-specific phosphodiesterase class I)
MGPIGIGMALLDGARRDAYEQLGHAEVSAESALRQGRRGYELYGDTSVVPAEALDARSTRCKSMLEFLNQGSVAFRKLRYASRATSAPETVELIPMPFPSSSDGEPYQAAESCGLALEFDLFVCRRALHELGGLFMQGRLGRLIFRQSVAVLNEPDYLEFIRGEMRRLQIVGTGLMVEFDLSALAGDLINARNLIAELAGLGIGVTLGNFSCNETSYKVLAYLKADAVRPKPLLLNIKERKIRHIALQLHSLHAEIILPRVARRDQIASEWFESADTIQAEFSD